MERISRNFLEIKSSNKLLKVNKPIDSVEINLLIPPDFQLNKFLYKQIGKKILLGRSFDLDRPGLD